MAHRWNTFIRGLILHNYKAHLRYASITLPSTHFNRGHQFVKAFNKSVAMPCSQGSKCNKLPSFLINLILFRTLTTLSYNRKWDTVVTRLSVHLLNDYTIWNIIQIQWKFYFGLIQTETKCQLNKYTAVLSIVDPCAGNWPITVSPTKTSTRGSVSIIGYDPEKCINLRATIWNTYLIQLKLVKAPSILTKPITVNTIQLAQEWE